MNNNEARRELEKLFGKICFIEKLGLRYIPPSKRKKIKGYSKYDDMLTYHHIHERHLGGKATVENGAIVRGYNHKWLHSLPEREKQLVNQAMQNYKASVLKARQNGVDIRPEDILSPEDIQEILAMTALSPLDLDTEKRKEKFNRAKQKRETRQLIDDALYGEWEDEER